MEALGTENIAIIILAAGAGWLARVWRQDTEHFREQSQSHWVTIASLTEAVHALVKELEVKK